jgi:hypothetical protein
VLGLTRRIPDGYSAADLFPGNGTPPLRVCVLRRDEPDGVGGRFVVVRDVLDASVYLGACSTRRGRSTRGSRSGCSGSTRWGIPRRVG